MRDNKNLIRSPSVSGSFYPSDKTILENYLEKYLEKVEKINTCGNLKILIVPHAGIAYSGQTAAWGFKQLENQGYHQIILLGASHHLPFSHAAVYSQGYWQTPFRKTAINEDLARSFIDKEKNIIEDEKPHKDEHCLEIELIFLQKILSEFSIVPILVSNPSDRLIDHLAQKISKYLDEHTILIVSSDFSHYPSFEIANKVDQETIRAILTGSKDQFIDTVKKQDNSGYPNLSTCACGQEAIKVALEVTRILKLDDIRLLKYENSGDRGSDINQVVGYATIGFYENK